MLFDSLPKELGVQPASYQRKHCLTTAVKALSSLPPSLFLLLSLSLPHFCIFLFWCLVALCLVFDTKQGAVPGAQTQYLVN